MNAHFKLITLDRGDFYTACFCQDKVSCKNRSVLKRSQIFEDSLVYDDLTLEDLAKARKMIGPSTNENEQNKLKEYFSKEENDAVLMHSFSFEDEEMNASRENLRSFLSCQACILFMCVLGVIIVLCFLALLISRNSNKIMHV